jgi:hypothetical protein
MILNKTAAALFIITLVMKTVASTTPDGIQGSDSFDKPVLPIKKQKHAFKPKVMLQDTDDTVNPVEAQEESNGEVDTLQEQPVDQRKNGPGFFETLLSRGRYKRVCYFARRIGNEKFLKRICPLINSLEQYNGIRSYLERHDLVTKFYINGNIEVVKEAIIEWKTFNAHYYARDTDLENALPLALNNDNHDRVIGLLRIRQEITAESDKQCAQDRRQTSFELFVSSFLYHLSPWTDSMSLKRFLTIRGDEMRCKYPGIIDTLCQELVGYLKTMLDIPSPKKLLIDLIGQPSLLTSMSFAEGFLSRANYNDRSAFIDYAWKGAIRNGLKKEYGWGSKELWQIMQKVHPARFTGEFPETEKAIAAVLVHFPTKHELEERWAKKNAPALFKKVRSLGFTLDFLPDVMWNIVFEYAILWTDI